MRRSTTVRALGFLLAATAAIGGAAGDEPEQRQPVPVLVELFTSEGCSSCPPADAYFSQLLRLQPVRGVEIIGLSQHVDYWDDLGWKDPYAAPEFTRRQREYARRFGSRGVYTPQLVVDGRAELVGGDRGQALIEIKRASSHLKARIELERIADSRQGEPRLAVRVSELPQVSDGDSAELWLALTESGLASEVSRGENAGQRLRHDGVTLWLRRVAEIEPGRAVEICEKLPLRGGATVSPGSRAVAFVQERDSGRVLGAFALDLAP